MFCISLAAFRFSKLCLMVSVCDIDIPRYCHSSEYILVMVAWPLLSLTASCILIVDVDSWTCLIFVYARADFNGALLCTSSAVYWPSWRDKLLFWSWLCRPHLEAILSTKYVKLFSFNYQKFSTKFVHVHAPSVFGSLLVCYFQDWICWTVSAIYAGVQLRSGAEVIMLLPRESWPLIQVFLQEHILTLADSVQSFHTWKFAVAPTVLVLWFLLHLG